MNLIKYICNKLKTQWDELWVEIEKQTVEQSPESE